MNGPREDPTWSTRSAWHVVVLVTLKHLKNLGKNKDSIVREKGLLTTERIAAMESRVEGACQIEAGPAFVHGFGLALYKGARDYLLSNRDRFLEEAEGGQRLVAE